MPYQIRQFSTYKRTLKSVPKDIASDFNDAIRKICSDPLVAETLSDKTVRSYHFGRSPERRIVYAYYSCKSVKQNACLYEEQHDENCTIDQCQGVIDFIAVYTREEAARFYANTKLRKDYIRPAMRAK
jgi:mRNA-degrading endonuclease RelE of RelBE toxin-antitoxin system